MDMQEKPSHQPKNLASDNLPAPSQTAPNAVAQKSKSLALQLPKDKGDLLTNFCGGTEQDEIDASRAMSPCDLRLDSFVGKTITVVGVVMNMAEFESQEVKGEMVERIYASIVLADGTVIGTTGKAVMGQLAYLIGQRPSGRFNPPVEFEVRTHKSPSPKQPYYSLRRVLPQAKQPRKDK